LRLLLPIQWTVVVPGHGPLSEQLFTTSTRYRTEVEQSAALLWFAEILRQTIQLGSGGQNTN
jgi:hypothetical protein